MLLSFMAIYSYSFKVFFLRLEQSARFQNKFLFSKYLRELQVLTHSRKVSLLEWYYPLQKATIFQLITSQLFY